MAAAVAGRPHADLGRVDGAVEIAIVRREADQFGPTARPARSRGSARR